MFTSSVGLPNETSGETESAQGHVQNRIECPSLANRKRLRTGLAESAEMAARANQRDNATGSCISSVEKDACHDQEESRPSLVASSALISSADPGQEVVQEEASSDEIPDGWTRIKLEPDW